MARVTASVCPSRHVAPALLAVLLFACGSDGASSTGAPGADAGPTPAQGDGGSDGPSSNEGSANGFAFAFTPSPVAFDCAETADQLLAKNVTHVTIGSATMFVGYEQVAATDQDPVVARWDSGAKVFCEHTKKGGGVDGRAYGVTWDGSDRLYVVFTIVGGGTLFDSAAAGGWLTSYGNGGASAKASVVGRVNATTGVLESATFVESKLLKNGALKTNTLVPADAVHVLGDGNLEFYGQPTYCTLNPDQSLMCDPAQSSDYPKDYRARFTPDLKTMLCASASGVSLVKKPCP